MLTTQKNWLKVSLMELQLLFQNVEDELTIGLKQESYDFVNKNIHGFYLFLFVQISNTNFIYELKIPQKRFEMTNYSVQNGCLIMQA